MQDASLQAQLLESTLDNVQFQGRGRGAAPEKTVEDIKCECTRPNTNVHCNMWLCDGTTDP